MQKVTPGDTAFMRRALDLARRGEGCVHPNPLVGAVLVKGGRIISEAYHEHFGGPHAEVLAVKKCAQSVKGATLYVTLEPCAHTGKTPPCTDFLIRSGLKKIVIASEDLNPRVQGRGIRELRGARLDVTVGVLREEARELNRDFNRWVTRGLPYAVIKIAQSLDGKIATGTGQSRWITGEQARRFSHRLRASSDALLVGVNTVLKDDPLLTVRHGGRKDQHFREPLRVILDSRLRTPSDARLFSKKSSGPVLLATTRTARPKPGLARKAEVLKFPSKKGRVDLRALFHALARRGIVKILIEGGGETVGEALNLKLAQEIYCFVAPKIIGGRNSVPSVGGAPVRLLSESACLRNVSVRPVGQDLLIHGYFR